MKKKEFSVSFILFICFVVSIIYAIFSIAYKVKYYGFSINPNKNVDVWLVEAKISYQTTGEPVKIFLTAPNNKTILGDSTNADGYTIKETNFKNKKIIEFTRNDEKNGDLEKLYYKILLLENKNIKYNFDDEKFYDKVELPYFDESQKESAKKLINFSKSIHINDDFITNLILLLNEKPSTSEVKTFISLKTSQRKIFDILKSLLAFENIPVRMVRGVKLVEGKTFQKPDLLLEAYTNNRWQVYDLETGKIGIPDNFLIFQHGGDSLLDVEGGKNSKILFSVLKTKYNALFLSRYRAESNEDSNSSFKYSMYNLPIREQNIFKFMTVFPLAILAIVILRNIIGITTMGTFTPMLIAMSFIETGLLYGLISFIFLISVGLFVRRLFSKLNLLLVPRISAVVILVIFTMQFLTIISYNFNLKVGASLIFFPLIITAWMIERSSIIMEENGEKAVIKQNLTTLVVSIFTYLVISSEKIRYIMYVFNELNICILFLVMLIGTYTGYRLTELLRFKTLIKDND